MDVGCYVVALAFRRGLFKNYNTIEELLDSDEYQLVFKDEVLKQAFFVAAKPRGYGIDPEKPMWDLRHREFMQRIAIMVGLGGTFPINVFVRLSKANYITGSEAGVTSYAMRRNFATTIKRVKNADIT